MRVDIVEGEALVVAVEVVADGEVVPDIFGPLQVREVRADIEALLLGDVVIDADDVVPVGILRVLALGVVVGAVDRARPDSACPRERRSSSPSGLIRFGGNHVVRQRLAAVTVRCRRAGSSTDRRSDSAIRARADWRNRPLRMAAVGTASTTHGDGSKLQMPS